jgi:hypothetical protein
MNEKTNWGILEGNLLGKGLLGKGISGKGLLGSEATLAQQIAAWQNAHSDLVPIAGRTPPYSANQTLPSNAATRTILDPAYAFRQDGFLYRVVFSGIQVGGTYKIKVFRYNGTAYVMTGETPAFTPDNAAYTLDLATPLAVAPGDIPGLHMAAVGSSIKADVLTKALLTRYVNSDVTTSDAFGNTIAWYMDWELFTHNPYLAVTGDSIAEGHNNGGSTSASSWHSRFSDVSIVGVGSAPGGLATSEIANQLRGLVSGLQYQNQSLGGQGFDWCRTTGVPACVVLKPHTILIHSGFNDVFNAVAWADVESDLNAIKALLVAGEQLLIDEILPSNNLDDVQAATVRTYNGNLATWCAANGATLIVCHDEMGQVRVSTGQMDDYIAAYTSDGTHLSTAGVDKMAEIIKRYL